MLLKDMRYDNAQDVQLRLNNSVVRYKNRPVFVGQNLQTPVQNAQDLILDVYDLLEQKWIDKVHSSDEDLEVKAMPLGYMNDATDALYIMRQPCRRSRQGLSVENCYYYVPVTNQISNIKRTLLKSLAFGKMVIGDYPGLEQALKTLYTHKVKSVAIGRKVSVMMDEIGLIKLVYFTTPVGVYNKRHSRFFIPERFEHYVPVLAAHDVDCTLED